VLVCPAVFKTVCGRLKTCRMSSILIHPRQKTGERRARRREDIDDRKASLRAQLANTSIQEPDGTIHKVIRRADFENPRS